MIKRCLCGCGEIVVKRFVNAGHATRRNDSQRRGPRISCACGCGVFAAPNKKFLRGHNRPGFVKGREAWNKGKPFPIESRLKMSKARKATAIRGQDHWNYKHGRTISRFSVEGSYENWFIVTNQIRERDNNTCRVCHRHQSNFKRRLSVHHIDDDPTNGEEWNLITLCNSCRVRLHNGKLELVV